MKQFLGALIFIATCFGIAATAPAYPLTEAQKDRLEKYIPRTYRKLAAQELVHIVTLGDSVTWMWTPEEDSGNFLKAYPAAFAQGLAREFFYPGGVRILNPQKGMPEKEGGYMGKEILIENLAMPGRCALDVLQHITTDAFLNEPDLVMINYGINDALLGHPLEVYRESLQRAIDACEEKGVDVIILAPSAVRQGVPPLEWGMTRPYATVASEVAQRNRVLFVDLGKVVTGGDGIPAGQEAEEAILGLSETIGKIFDFGEEIPERERLHPNVATQRIMGEAIYDQLMNGLPEPVYTLTGRAIFQDPETVKVTVFLKNESEQPRKGYLGALTNGQILQPREMYQTFALKPGEAKPVELTYVRRLRSGDGTEEEKDYFPLDATEPSLRFSYLVADEEKSCLMDVVLPLEPVSVSWKTEPIAGVDDMITLIWKMVNRGPQPVEGTYEVFAPGQPRVYKGNFQVPQGDAKSYYVNLKFEPPADVVRLHWPIRMKVTVGGRVFIFQRSLEATQDLALGEKMALSQYSEYTAGAPGKRMLPAGQPSVSLRADADDQALYFVFDIEKTDFVELDKASTMIADLSIDARPADERGTLGFVDRLRITTGAEDGPGKTDRPFIGVFGDGYDRLMDPAYITSELETRGNDERRLTVRIPRTYLYRHEWNIGDPASTLGVNVNLSFLSVDAATGQPGYPAERRWVLAASDLYFRDARGLVTLRLSREPATKWSVRVY